MEAPSMRKIGKLSRLLLILMAVMAGFTTASAQNIQVSAELSETNIFTGEQVKLSLTISGNSVDEPELPPIDGLRWIRGNTSRSTKYSIVNGNPSVTYTFGYFLIAENSGSYTLPPIQITVNGEIYQTEPINFKVLDRSTLDSDDAERNPDIYLRMEPSSDQPVVGQQVVVDVILYFKSDIEVSSYQPTPGWKAEGFWKEELEYPQRAQTSSTIVNGTRYQQARLLQYALFPTKSGELTLSPFEITVSIRKRRSSSDPFGFGLGQERINLASVPVPIDVQTLPDLENAQFVGAVGQFDISRSINPKNALVGESIEITTRIKGTGNVTLVNKPDYEIPEGLEKYNPQENSVINRIDRKISGTRTFTDIVIARNEGTFVIPESRVAYYDPARKRYVTVRLQELSFVAKRDPNAATVTQDDLRFNIKPITGLAQWTSNESSALYQKSWVWVLIFLPILITVIAYGYKQYHDRMHTDTAFARSRTAMDKAQKTLSEAAGTEDLKQGYYLIDKALMQFITDKLNLPPAGLSHADIITAMMPRADSETIAELKRLLTKCETIAYAPNTSKESLKADVDKTTSLIKKIGKLA